MCLQFILATLSKPDWAAAVFNNYTHTRTQAHTPTYKTGRPPYHHLLTAANASGPHLNLLLLRSLINMCLTISNEFCYISSVSSFTKNKTMTTWSHYKQVYGFEESSNEKRAVVWAVYKPFCKMLTLVQRHFRFHFDLLLNFTFAIK